MKPSCFFLFILSLPIALRAHPGVDIPPWQMATAWPDRIVTTLPGDPTTGFAVSWRTDMSVGEAIAQIAPASSDARFDLNATTRKAVTTPLALDHFFGTQDNRIAVPQNHGLPLVHFHSVTFSGLEPDTLYAYRVRGNRGKWSAWRQFRTAPETGPFEFLFFGDAQTGIRSHITRIFDMAGKVAPDARFAIHGGDLVNTAFYDQEWAEWFEAVGSMHLMIPSIPVSGNHDYINLSKIEDDPEDDKLFMMEKKRVSPIWRPQFALPVESALPEWLHETVYDVRYGEDLHIFVLDSSGIVFDEQLAWLSEKLEASDAKWKLVTMHHPVYSFVGGTEHPSHKKMRLAMVDVMEKQDIDIVITGHRHTYQRASFGDDVVRYAIGDEQEIQTVTIVTASSTKRGETKVEGWDRYSEWTEGAFELLRHGDNTPLFSRFRLDEETLSYEAIDAVGEIYDTFTLTKDDSGKKTLVNGPSAKEPVKSYHNTGKYIRWDDLR